MRALDAKRLSISSGVMTIELHFSDLPTDLNQSLSLTATLRRIACVARFAELPGVHDVRAIDRDRSRLAKHLAAADEVRGKIAEACATVTLGGLRLPGVSVDVDAVLAFAAAASPLPSPSPG